MTIELNQSRAAREHCNYPNGFSDVFAPAVEQKLPGPGTLGSRALDHSTHIPSFLDTVAADLCDDGRMGAESRDAAVSFISRSAITGFVLTGTGTLAAIGVAVAGSPLLAVGLGVAGLVLLPPLAEKMVKGVGSFLANLLPR